MRNVGSVMLMRQLTICSYAARWQDMSGGGELCFWFKYELFFCIGGLSWIIGVPGKIRNVVEVGLAAIFWAIWKTRNKACFENVFPYDPTSVIVQAARWLDFWPSLQRQGLRGIQVKGARMLLRVAAEVFSRTKGWAPRPRG